MDLLIAVGYGTMSVAMALYLHILGLLALCVVGLSNNGVGKENIIYECVGCRFRKPKIFSFCSTSTFISLLCILIYCIAGNLQNMEISGVSLQLEKHHVVSNSDVVYERTPKSTWQ